LRDAVTPCGVEVGRQVVYVFDNIPPALGDSAAVNQGDNHNQRPLGGGGQNGKVCRYPCKGY
jgi:hypothetical protein